MSKKTVKLLGEKWIEYAEFYEENHFLYRKSYTGYNMPTSETTVALQAYTDIKSFFEGKIGDIAITDRIKTTGRYLIGEFFLDDQKHGFIGGENGWCPPSVEYNHRDALFKFIVTNRHKRLFNFQPILDQSLRDFVEQSITEYNHWTGLDGEGCKDWTEEERKKFLDDFASTIKLYFDPV